MLEVHSIAKFQAQVLAIQPIWLSAGQTPDLRLSVLQMQEQLGMVQMCDLARPLTPRALLLEDLEMAQSMKMEIQGWALVEQPHTKRRESRRRTHLNLRIISWSN